MYSLLHLNDSSRNVTVWGCSSKKCEIWVISNFEPMSRCWSKSRVRNMSKRVNNYEKNSTKGIVFKVVLSSMGALINLKWKHCTYSWNAILSFFTLFLIQSQVNQYFRQCSIITRGILSRLKYLSKLSSSTVLARPAAQSLTSSLVLLPRTCSISAKVQTEQTGGTWFLQCWPGPKWLKILTKIKCKTHFFKNQDTLVQKPLKSLKGGQYETNKHYLVLSTQKNAQPIIVFESASLFPICI